MPFIRLAMAQSNPIVGDISGNLAKLLELTKQAAAQGANLVQFGEMSITGYPVEDLVTRDAFVTTAEAAVEELASVLVSNGLGEVAVVVGAPAKANQPNGWASANNRAFVLHQGKVIANYSKHHLPNYSVFDEYRNFVPGHDHGCFELFGFRFALAICEDIWQAGGPVSRISEFGTQLTLVLNGSPFEIDKDDRRLQLVQELAKGQDTAVSYVNLVGGQDDLVFDGDSIFVSADGSLVARGEQFAEDLVLIDFDGNDAKLASEHAQTKADDNWQVWNALVLGLRDYVQKNGFKSVVLGLSGGIDSAVVASIAADAIGGKNVFGISMPSKFSSEHSKDDASELAENIGCHYSTVAIENMVASFETQLELSDVARENLQARMRGVILMAESNTRGHLTLTTGNKSELAVGYSTIYGDSVGGFAPLKDVEKTLVWQLAKWRNAWALENGETPPIPENSISKPPSAELRPDQTDQDSLPEYDLLDAILDAYVEKRMSAKQIIAAGFNAETVHRVLTLVDRAEWKRRQGAIGPKITGMAFGRDRRLPITNKYKG
jgi:NAD+ synthase (glutamine-hydrolysing)